jgi:branched-chain amino acid transport system substrate-binding protein
MRELPTEGWLFGKGTVRVAGRKIHPMCLIEVKPPTESKGPWDYFKVNATIPAEEAFPVLEGGCPLVNR